MTIREMIALIMLREEEDGWILGMTVDGIECNDDEICIYPRSGSCIEISKSEYLKEEE